MFLITQTGRTSLPLIMGTNSRITFYRLLITLKSSKLIFMVRFIKIGSIVADLKVAIKFKLLQIHSQT